MNEKKDVKYKKRKIEKHPKNNLKKKENEDYKTTVPIEEKNTINKNSNSKTKKQLKKKNVSSLILKKINYKQLSYRLFLLLLVMMIIIFTITRIKKIEEKRNAILYKNVESILNTTLTYFKNNDLPKNIGDSSSFILEEIKNLSYINEIKDENEKYCNYLDSYVILTKLVNDEYRLKVYLKCSSKEKTVVEKVTCNESNCIIKK